MESLRRRIAMRLAKGEDPAAISTILQCRFAEVVEVRAAMLPKSLNLDPLSFDQDTQDFLDGVRNTWKDQKSRCRRGDIPQGDKLGNVRVVPLAILPANTRRWIDSINREDEREGGGDYRAECENYC